MEEFLKSNKLTDLTAPELKSISGGGVSSPWKFVWDQTVGYVITEVVDGIARGLARPCK